MTPAQPWRTEKVSKGRRGRGKPISEEERTRKAHFGAEAPWSSAREGGSRGQSGHLVVFSGDIARRGRTLASRGRGGARSRLGSRRVVGRVSCACEGHGFGVETEVSEDGDDRVGLVDFLDDVAAPTAGGCLAGKARSWPFSMASPHGAR